MIPMITTNENVRMPALIYGTAWKKERTADLVEMAVKSGFRGIDTACQPRHYHEAGVGEALKRLGESGIERESLFIQTKFTPASGQDAATIPYDPASALAEQVKRSFEVSKHNLGTDYVDSLVLHSPLFPYRNLSQVWEAMEFLYDSKGVRQLGISNCYDLELLEKLYADARIKPAVVQNRFYPDSGYDQDIRTWCTHRGIVYQSFWSLTANPHLLFSETVQSLSRAYGRTPAQIFYRFLNHIGIVPLIGSTSPQHIAEDLDIFGFELTSYEVDQIDSLLRS
ncbi:MAG: aldo/keto reductase family protein [Sulfuricurvum sp.]